MLPRRTALFARLSLTALLALVVLAPSLSHARTVRQKKQFARSQFEIAQRMREALRGRPEAQRTEHDYDKVMDVYREVYHTAPTSVKADASVVAVAELLAESARLFNDERRFHSAIGQYEFLRHEYPGSKYRFDALFTIGQIYREDLNDPEKAQEAFAEFVKRYPNHHLAEDAQTALHEMEAQARHPGVKQSPFRPKLSKGPELAHESHTDQEPQVSAANKNAAETAPFPEEPPRPAQGQDENASSLKPAAVHSGLPLVTSIRHWSTPDYTRIAIDLQQEVKYQAGRVPSPDRIFFDLYNTKLASELVGKSFDVEDGFLRKIRVAQYKHNMTRVVLEVDEVAEYSAFLLPNPYRLIIDIHGKKPSQPQTLMAKAETGETLDSSGKNARPENSKPAGNLEDKTAKQPRDNRQLASAPGVSAGQTPPIGRSSSAADKSAKEARSSSANQNGKEQSNDLSKDQSNDETGLGASEIASLSQSPADQKATSRPTSKPIVQNVAPRETTSVRAGAQPSGTSSPDTARGAGKKLSAHNKKMPPSMVTHVAQPTSDGDRSLIRALGLKIGKIVVDAGHGGHDTGTIGPNGLREKDLVLDVALRLGKLLEHKLGADVVYTRDDDTFVPLETRTAIANQSQADLFISIHANSSSDPNARGVETYYLNFTSSASALEVAARENAVSEKSIHELQDLVKKIALKEKIEESREFAGDVDKSLHDGLAARSPGLKDRGVKKAPFIVLIGANMPSILAEISFVSNPVDERRLMKPEYRQKIAESLYRGVAKYVSGLSGVKVASASTAPAGQ